MNGDREEIMDALCARLFAIPGFNTTGRRLIHWRQIPAAKQPAIFTRNIGDNYLWKNGILLATVMRVEVWIYRLVGMDLATIPGALINNLVKTVEGALAPDDFQSGCCTLGGLVQWARLEGDSDFDPGDMDGQAKAILPVRILVP